MDTGKLNHSDLSKILEAVPPEVMQQLARCVSVRILGNEVIIEDSPEVQAIMAAQGRSFWPYVILAIFGGVYLWVGWFMFPDTKIAGVSFFAFGLAFIGASLCGCVDYAVLRRPFGTCPWRLTIDLPSDAFAWQTRDEKEHRITISRIHSFLCVYDPEAYYAEPEVCCVTKEGKLLSIEGLYTFHSHPDRSEHKDFTKLFATFCGKPALYLKVWALRDYWYVLWLRRVDQRILSKAQEIQWQK